MLQNLQYEELSSLATLYPPSVSVWIIRSLQSKCMIHSNSHLCQHWQYFGVRSSGQGRE